MSPNSPFYAAYRQLLVDAALRNQSLFVALGDGGSGNETGNGLTNVGMNLTSPYAVMVGGTSLSTITTAEGDSTLDSIVDPALAGDRTTIWQLVAGGLTSLPSDASALQTFVETTWNAYQVSGTAIGTPDGFGSYLLNNTTSGGVDPSQNTPAYQTSFGLAPVTTDLLAEPGRGTPDVSANSAGNLQYLVPDDNMLGGTGSGGTSAATPFWAALTLQFNAIFADQELPQLGYMNDLLYIAAAVAPAAFNDVTLGGNMSSFTLGGSYQTSDGDGSEINVTPTGYGYYAGPGYDLVTGLGSPNGFLLARALTTIAHSQISYASSPDMLDAEGSGWESGADQSLLFQTMSGSSANIGLDLGSDILSFTSVATGSYAWTNRVAQQSMQSDFDPNLVRLFDKYGQGAMVQSMVSQGEDVGVSINASAADAIQGALSSPFGFADFVTDSGVVRVARPVAIAETVGRAGRPDGDRAGAPERRGQPVGELLPRRRSFRLDRRPAGGTGRLRPDGAGPRLSDRGRRHVDRRAGLWQLRTGGAARCRCRRPDRHEARQPDQQRHLLGLRPGQRDGVRPVGRASVELRAEYLGLGGRAQRRRSRLQRPDRAVRLHQQLRPRLAGLSLRLDCLPGCGETARRAGGVMGDGVWGPYPSARFAGTSPDGRGGWSSVNGSARPTG